MRAGKTAIDQARLPAITSTGWRLGPVEDERFSRRMVLWIGCDEYVDGEVAVVEMERQDGLRGIVTYRVAATLMAEVRKVDSPVALVSRLDPRDDEEALAYEVMGASDEVQFELLRVFDYGIERFAEGASRLTFTGSK